MRRFGASAAGAALLLHVAAVGAAAAPSGAELARRARCAGKYPPEALEALRGALHRGGDGADGGPPHVFFAALLHNNAPVLEGWIAALDWTIAQLGASRAHVSILESGSTDGTDTRLRAWAAELTARGVAHTIRTGAEPVSVLRPFRTGDTGILRIEFLAKLRNEVLAPMWTHLDALPAASGGVRAQPSASPGAGETGAGGVAGRARRADSGAALAAQDDELNDGLRRALSASAGAPNASTARGGVPARFDRLVFLNDVVFCEGDLLRLLLHGTTSRASLACGLDFHRSDGPGESDFYDKWVLTDIHGRHALPPSIGGGAPERPMHKRPGAWLPLRADRAACGTAPPAPCARRVEEPVQVFCCWNGIAVFDTAPFYDGARFRWAAGLDPAAPGSAECAASECSLMCKDLWRIGHGRILLDPAIQVAYSYRTHAARLRHFGAGAMGAVPPAVALDAPQPDAWDCYGLAEPGARGIRWRAPPVRESLAANRGALPYRAAWQKWPAVVISSSERRAREAERARWEGRGAVRGAAGALSALGVVALLARCGWRRRQGGADYVRIGPGS
ncbi:hypothetical protein KFE25_002383 [Diacronema lutheri]|uniref:Protein xylosyltransferase n=2 Tax=Diacronema lutheri TaxID=2081491 RepID=A0A8J5XI92_DIALT|nr:hypothetical protein KFE25_002383 [Diacronema lutheri]